MLSRLREPFSGISHGAGALVSLLGLAVLLERSRHSPLHLLCFLVYGSSLVLLFTASAVYHSLKVQAQVQERLMRLDHCAIFLLIAGTYTPICLLALRGRLGNSLCVIEWGLALAGIISSLLLGAPDWFRVLLYLIMGWLVTLTIHSLRAALSPEAFDLTIAGGLFYSVGTVIFSIDRPHLWPGRFSAHDLWHLFVIMGSMCYYILMVRFLAPVS